MDPAGASPEFRAPAVTLEFDAISAFANSVNLAVAQARQASHEAAYGALKATLRAIASGAADELSVRWNVDAYRSLRLVPRQLRDVSTLDLGVTLLGHRLAHL